MAQKHTGKIALITGANKGIGFEVARQLGTEGITVLVGARNPQLGEAAAAKLKAEGADAHFIELDVTKSDTIVKVAEQIRAQYGRLDILVNNAGVYKVDSLETLSAESFDEHFHLNVRGLLLTTQAAARVLPAGGVIVNISSGLAKSPYPMVHVYCATKGAVDTLTRTLGIELGPRNIRVVGIAPGFVATEGNAESAKDMSDFLVAKTPLGRVGQPRDIAAAVSYAVSEDAGWVTGCTIDVAGGMVF